MIEWYKPLAMPKAINGKLSKNDGKPKVDEAMYRSLVGSLICFTHTRPNTVNAVNIVSSFMSNPIDHLTAGKRILRYIKDMKSYEIMYETEENFKRIIYKDSDWAGSIYDQKSTS